MSRRHVSDSDLLNDHTSSKVDAAVPRRLASDRDLVENHASGTLVSAPRLTTLCKVNAPASRFHVMVLRVLANNFAGAGVKKICPIILCPAKLFFLGGG